MSETQTQKKTKHTPGPLRIAEIHAEGLYLNDGSIALLGESGRVALVDIRSQVKRGTAHTAKCPERDANARRIVTCWNSYDGLLAALREARCWLPGEGTPDSRGAKCETFSQALELIDAALAKAEAHP